MVYFRYIYCGRLSLEEYDTLDIIKILVAANELSLEELITDLQSFLTKNKANWIEQNFNLTYQTSFESDNFLQLQKYCTDLITKEPDKIFKSPNFSSISERLLVSIIQNDNLHVHLALHDGSKFLDRHLQSAISHKQDNLLVRCPYFGSMGSRQAKSHSPQSTRCNKTAFVFEIKVP